MPKSIAELFNERGNNPHPVQRSHDNVSAGMSGQKPRRVEESIERDPFSLMSPEDAKQVTASSVNVSDAISEIGSMWSGKKIVESSRDLSKFADKKDLNDDEGDE